MSRLGEHFSLFPGVMLSLNKYQGVSGVSKFYYNPEIGNSQEDIWTPGATLTHLTSAETLDVNSSNANDTSEGTGARTVRIYGLNSDYEEITEDITMNGISDVTTTALFLRVYRMKVLTAGSSDLNEGDIIATASTAGTIQGSVCATEGQSLMCHYTIPAGYIGFLLESWCSAPAADDARIRMQVRELGGAWQIKNLMIVHESESRLGYSEGPCVVIPEKSDIRVQAIRIGGNNVEIAGHYSLVLVNNEMYELS